MRILVITYYFPPEIGTASHLFYGLSEGLSEKGHHVTVITSFPRYNIKKLPDKYKKKLFLREKMNGFEVIRVRAINFPRNIPFARGIDFFLAAFIFFIGGLISGKQDVIILYSPPLTMGLTSYLLGILKRAPFVISVQDLFPQSVIDLGLLKNKIAINLCKKMEQFIYKKASYITVHSEGNRRFIINSGVNPEKVSTIPNWEDTNFIKPRPRFNEFRVEHRLDNKFVVSFAGTMGYSQDLDTVIECAKLLENYHDILFLLVGDGVEKERLEEKAKNMRLRNVMFLPMQPLEKYPLVLNASDISLVTLKKRVKTPVIPSKILGIMASGRPAVLSLNKNGDAPKIIEAAQCGYCVEPANPEELAQAILTLYKNPSLREKLGKNGRKYVENNFSKELCIEKYENLLLEAFQNFKNR